MHDSRNKPKAAPRRIATAVESHFPTYEFHCQNPRERESDAVTVRATASAAAARRILRGFWEEVDGEKTTKVTLVWATGRHRQGRLTEGKRLQASEPRFQVPSQGKSAFHKSDN